MDCTYFYSLGVLAVMLNVLDVECYMSFASLQHFPQQKTEITGSGTLHSPQQNKRVITGSVSLHNSPQNKRVITGSVPLRNSPQNKREITGSVSLHDNPQKEITGNEREKSNTRTRLNYNFDENVYSRTLDSSNKAPTNQRGLKPYQRHKILHLHNLLRRKVSPEASNMKKMYWDRSLEKIAQEFAEKCTGSFNAERHKMKTKFNNIGENIHHTWDWRAEFEDGLWIQKTLPLNITKVIYKWWNEKERFDYRNPLSCSRCNHYRQIVRDVTYAVGCGTAFCGSVSGRKYRNAHIFVCNYGDGYGDTPEPYVEGPPCSGCPTAHPVCDDKLCDFP